MDLVKKLLIVDDDDFIIDLLSERLKDFYSITTCNGGAEALKLTQSQTFDIILLDYNMPELTGLDVLKEIRRSNIQSQVIIITAYPTYELAVQFNPYDVYEFVSKPFQLDALIHTVNKAWDKYYLVKIKNEFENDLIGNNKELRKLNDKLLKSNQKLDEALVQYEFNILFQKRLMELVDIFEHMGKVRSSDKLQAYIAKSVSHILRADRSTLYLVDEDAGEIYSCFAESCDKEIRMKIGDGIAGTVAQNKQTIRVEDAYQDERFDSRLDTMTTYVTKSVICMPLSDVSGNVIGVLESLNKICGSFTEDDEKVLKAFNSLASMTIQTIGLINENEKLKERLGE
ncbi:MAG: response regulator [Candidatus Cloacimonetes bacterium]|nr:response regulator [Candidatus Cloacimonadota bacterium]